MERLTPRLRLRELREDDFDALYAVLGDSDITRHSPYTFDEARVRNWIARNRRRYETLGFGLWAVTLRETGELIGDCGLTLQNINGELLPEIGYHIRRDRQRQGYATEAAQACRDWAFATPLPPALLLPEAEQPPLRRHRPSHRHAASLRLHRRRGRAQLHLRHHPGGLGGPAEKSPETRS